MLTALLTIGLAHGGGRWDGVPADVQVMSHVDASPAQVTGFVSNLENWASLFDTTCAQDWAWGSKVEGPRARARVTHRTAWWKRRLTVVVREAREDLVQLEYEGTLGFEARVTATLAPDGGSDVSVTTYLKPPPWPIREVFYLTIKPAWEACYAGALDSLNRHLSVDPSS